MRRFIAILFIASISLTSCSQSPSLWGTYATPTSELFFPTMFVPEPQPATASPTNLPLPTGTFTPTPTLIPLQTSTGRPPFNKTPVVETTLTAMSESPPSSKKLSRIPPRSTIHRAVMTSQAWLADLTLIPLKYGPIQPYLYTD